MKNNILISQNINVNFSYDLHFTNDVFNSKNTTLLKTVSKSENKAKILFFVEKELLRHFPDLSDRIINYSANFAEKIDLIGNPIILEGGESLKSFDPIMNIVNQIADAGLCRQSYVCIIGGGAFLDLVGLAAALVHRGIRQIRFPTTVLSQNDSGVGVKNGINMFGQKNYIGTFAPPYAVINDFDFLDSLSDRDWISGVAEAFKVAIIKDSDFFNYLYENIPKIKERNKSVIHKVIIRCAEIHLKHIAESGDPFEMGAARPLDFGHWAAHKMEILSNGNIRHGEAVAAGIALDSCYAEKLELINSKTLDSIINAFIKLGFELYYPEMEDSRLFDGLKDFQDHLGEKLHITLPDGLGNKIEVNQMDLKLIQECVKILSRFSE